MKRSYAYKAFTVVVETDPVVPASRNAKLQAPEGFFAVVQITSGQGAPITSPVRLSGVGERPFASEAEALMSGHTAGQRLIEDLAEGERDEPSS
ncbi:hypothetical protein [Caballeronia telluris]|uniref:Uncharacterized protein n=1 Tax=Caballeronia telluris TaxID=326475 RepID=A0A158K5W6_9BURK|nr:hypothetical protein [Caballeronia telluris]SAL76538.1 hypothetical protein AWB66_05429 [Caballeronia telluris]